MPGTRKRYSAAFKARVPLETARQTRTVAELSKAFQVHPVQISQWKKQLLDGAESLWGDGGRHERKQSEDLQAELYRYAQLRMLGFDQGAIVEGIQACQILPKNHAGELALVSSGGRWFHRLPNRESAWLKQSPAIRPLPCYNGSHAPPRLFSEAGVGPCQDGSPGTTGW
jgi:transposase-like protein